MVVPAADRPKVDPAPADRVQVPAELLAVLAEDQVLVGAVLAQGRRAAPEVADPAGAAEAIKKVVRTAGHKTVETTGRTTKTC